MSELETENAQLREQVASQATLLAQLIERIQTLEASLSLKTGPDFSFLAENLLLLKQVEYQNRFYRYLAVLKMRDNKFEGTFREHTIEEQTGLRVLEPDQSVEELLNALAQKPV